ncbi:hypothetical protein [Paraburkholderia strydomiana]|uniref:hypothetical protein n=1 Tax=Paraburkholderia strydomiana TaxID=1245417 RepID=UPI0038B8A95C
MNSDKRIDIEIALHKFHELPVEDGDLGYTYWYEVGQLLKRAAAMQAQIDSLSKELAVRPGEKKPRQLNARVGAAVEIRRVGMVFKRRFATMRRNAKILAASEAMNNCRSRMGGTRIFSIYRHKATDRRKPATRRC